ncbi:MAG: hypothetical protein MRZ74_12805 [Blautia sp.]|nr:hypothetical protein [Blautia sp.]MDY5032067.1 hypothetical protein [Blautia sp.]
MSDLAATNCGCMDERSSCGCDNSCGCDCCNNGLRFGGFGNGSCSCNILWIIILLSVFGNGCRSGCDHGCGDNDNCCLIIILLLLCGGFGNGCGC